MLNLLSEISRKVNHLIWSFLTTGLILLLLAVLLVWSDWIVIEMLFAILVLIVAFSFLFGAYKIFSIKAEIERYISIKK